MLFAASASLFAAYTAPAVTSSSDHWAVLVAGSSGYGNYRHQSDVCHAYHVVTKSGIPPSNVIVLAVDDIANYRSNPYPGQMFNKPTPAGTPGVDVYAGCKIDYSGTKVTPTTFTQVLTGDSSAGGKVLGSTSSSKVFVNFVDHGAVGLIGFPHTTMHAKELMSALTTMHSKNMYSELVFYLEACESGSMFQDLKPDMGIYATTASNAKESSWGTYCSPDDKVDGKSINSCLGDLYSVKWMEDSDQLIDGETLDDQFQTVKTATTKSHVVRFGNMSMTSEKVVAFMGADDSVRKTVTATATDGKEYMSRPSADATLASAFDRFLDGDDEAGAELIKGVQERTQAKRRFNAISKAVSGAALSALPPHEGKVHMDCHYAAHKSYIATCGEWDAGAMAYSATLAQLCKHTDGSSAPITAAITAACA
jgi:legumain